MAKILAIILAGLRIIVSIFKWLFGKERRKKQQIKEGEKAVDSKDPSEVTKIFDRLNSSIIFFICLMIILIAGCAPTIILHPIDKTDIFSISKGQKIEAPKDGWFISDVYLKEIIKVKVEKQ